MYLFASSVGTIEIMALDGAREIGQCCACWCHNHCNRPSNNEIQSTVTFL